MATFLPLTALIAGCLSPTPTGPSDLPEGSTPRDPGLEVVSVEVFPARSVLSPGGTLQFRAEFRTANGETVTDSVDWTAEEGTIDAKGRFKAPGRNGKIKVIARGRTKSTSTGEVPADTAEVEVDGEGDLTAADVVVTPGAASLAPGESIKFAAEVRNADGAAVESVVSWEASGGSVDADGSYTAGASAGTFSVMATADATVSDTSSVTVSAPAPPPPPSNSAPDADFAYSCDALSCDFDAGASSDSDGSIVEFAWSFGDGGESASETPSHSYSATGSYSVTLVVTDDDGASDSRTRNVGVSSGATPSGVQISPGQNIQAIVDANPAGTVFILKAGVHSGHEITPKDDNEFHGEPGAILDGAGTREFAFGSYGVPGARVLIKGLEIRNYVPRQLDFGAILGDNAVDWVVEDNVVHDIVGVGIRLGKRMIVRNNHTYGNDNLGIGGFRVDAAVIEGNEINGNGFAGRSGEYAGLKIVVGNDLVLRNNYVHDNDGRGLWLDTDIFDALVEDNVVTDNEKEGIWLEVVCGATVRGNRAERNGLNEPLQSGWPDKAGIQIVNGIDVDVHGNTVRDNLNGISILGATGYPTGYACVPDLRNVHVYDNDIRMEQGVTGGAENFGDPNMFNGAKNNRFENNRYTLGTESQYFIWAGSRMTESQWVNAGQDTGGTFDR